MLLQMDSWFGRRTKIVHQTKSYIPNPLSFFQSKGKFRPQVKIFCIVEEITQLALDDSRHILYALTDLSRISVFDLGSTGQAFTKAASTSLEQIVTENQYAVSCDSAFVKELVSITAIPSTCSLFVYLEAVTSYGIRIYFTCAQRVLVEKNARRVSDY